MSELPSALRVKAPTPFTRAALTPAVKYHTSQPEVKTRPGWGADPSSNLPRAKVRVDLLLCTAKRSAERFERVASSWPIEEGHVVRVVLVVHVLLLVSFGLVTLVHFIVLGLLVLFVLGAPAILIVLFVIVVFVVLVSLVILVVLVGPVILVVLVARVVLV